MMTPRDMLLTAARALGDALLEDVVFVGGVTTHLFVTDPGAPPSRATVDVDVIVEAATQTDYHNIGRALRARGFSEDSSEAAPLCRWVGHGLTLDVMPTDPATLGFSNQWYPMALARAQVHQLKPDLEIRCASPSMFIATKLEALTGRGADDFMASRDLEDLIAVVDGREELIDELRTETSDVREYIRLQFSSLLQDAQFVEAISAHLPGDIASQERVPIVTDRLRTLASL
jgi:predicted nucleotidyltransferase